MAYVGPEMIDALRGNSNLGVFFRLGTTPPLRLSFSVHDFPVQLPGDPTDAIYFGAGRLGNIPDLEALVNGIADTVTFTISGLDPVAASFMLDTAPEVLGAPVTVGIAPLDARWQPATKDVVSLWSGTADFLAESMAAETDPAKNRTLTLSLTAMTGDQSRQFQNLLTYSDAEQQRLHPGDLFCSRTPRYTQQQLISWPRF